MTKRICVLLVVLGVAFYGCSLLDPPEMETPSGSISLRFVRSEAPEHAARGLDALAAALAVADSIIVKVYPPGNGGTPEARKGVGIPPGTDTISVALTVVAENNKRVAVELYVTGRLAFFGVNEDVDVVTNQNTKVSIAARQFELGTVSVNPARVWDNETFGLSWRGVADATSYRVQQSPLPDFSIIAWETSTPDTFVSGAMPAGDYYFRIAAENVYTKTPWNEVLIHVGGVPLVTGLSAPDVLRKDTDKDFDVFGLDLDHPSTTVTVFGQECVIDWNNSSPTQLKVTLPKVPARAFSDVVTVTNTFGSDDSSVLVKVQTIAYIMGEIATGDWTAADDHKAMIEGYGALVRNSAVAIVPYPWIDFLDMSVFDVVVVGWDTGTSDSDWGGGGIVGQLRANDIEAGEASILGIGTGGASYFQLVGLDIGIKSCTLRFDKDAWVVNAAADVYNTPNPIGVANNDTLAVYSADVWGLAPIVDIFNPPAGIAVFAHDSTLTSFPLGEQTVPTPGSGPVKNFLWGFHASPRNLSSGVTVPPGPGAEIFENVIKRLFDDGTKDVAGP